MWKIIFDEEKQDVGEWLFDLALASGAGEYAFEWPGAVFVAYLDPACNLINVYAIRGLGEDPVQMVATDARWQRQRCQVLVGPAAELLYIAVGGKVLGDSPEDASPRRGAIARAILAANLDAPGFAEAYAAVAAWGDFIKPWYGTTVLDENGRLLLDLPEYGERLDIPMTMGD